jgi:hypothetical protein
VAAWLQFTTMLTEDVVERFYRTLNWLIPDSILTSCFVDKMFQFKTTENVL